MEREDHSITFDMNWNVLSNFKARKLNLEYAKQEFLWYLRGDRFDQTIEKYASMWAKIRQMDGGYHSNYGQYIFPDQFSYVVDELTRDRDSRRASIVLLNQSHLYADNTDTVCTYAINFRIRRDKLHMTVMMRSNDAVYGLTNDAFCFAMLYRMVFAELKRRHIYVGVGRYKHFANSLHIYEKHYDMVMQMIKAGDEDFTDIDMPWPSEDDMQILTSNIRTRVGLDFMPMVPEHFPFISWLTNTR
jgi:thymidylate synthase